MDAASPVNNELLLLLDTDRVDGGVAISVSSLLLLLAVEGSLSRRGELKKKDGAVGSGLSAISEHIIGQRVFCERRLYKCESAARPNLREDCCCRTTAAPACAGEAVPLLLDEGILQGGEEESHKWDY